jgi:hypothetical protein
MSTFLEEYKEWNSPIIGAYLLWCFSRGFEKNQQEGAAPNILHLFMAYPILMSDKLLSRISNKRKSISSFVKSYNEEKTSDIMICYSKDVNEKKKFCLEAIQNAFNLGLLVCDVKTANLIPKKLDEKVFQKNELYKKKAKQAFILGKLFSQESLTNLASILGVIL